MVRYFSTYDPYKLVLHCVNMSISYDLSSLHFSLLPSYFSCIFSFRDFLPKTHYRWTPMLPCTNLYHRRMKIWKWGKNIFQRKEWMNESKILHHISLCKRNNSVCTTLWYSHWALFLEFLIQQVWVGLENLHF